MSLKTGFKDLTRRDVQIFSQGYLGRKVLSKLIWHNAYTIFNPDKQLYTFSGRFAISLHQNIRTNETTE